MARQHRHAIEQPLGAGIRLSHVDLHRVLIELLHGDGLSSDDERIAKRRGHFLVQVDLKREQHIVGIERIAIRETNPAAERQREPAAIGRRRPRFRQRRFELLRFPIDVNQVGGRTANHIPRWTIDCRDGIERSRFSPLDYYDLPAPPPHLSAGDEPIDRSGGLLRARRPPPTDCPPGRQGQSGVQTVASCSSEHHADRADNVTVTFIQTRLMSLNAMRPPTRSRGKRPGSRRGPG